VQFLIPSDTHQLHITYFQPTSPYQCTNHSHASSYLLVVTYFPTYQPNSSPHLHTIHSHVYAYFSNHPFSYLLTGLIFNRIGYKVKADVNSVGFQIIMGFTIRESGFLSHKKLWPIIYLCEVNYVISSITMYNI